MEKFKKKIKELYNKNKIVFILIAVMIVCFIIIVIGLITSFYKKVSTSNYGDRLDDIKTVKISKSEQSEYKDSIEGLDGVTSASVDIKGKIIYIMIDFEADTKVKDAKEVATTALEEIATKEVKVYDIQFILSCDDNEKDYPTMGYKNNSSDSIVWINRN